MSMQYNEAVKLFSENFGVDNMNLMFFLYSHVEKKYPQINPSTKFCKSENCYVQIPVLENIDMVQLSREIIGVEIVAVPTKFNPAVAPIFQKWRKKKFVKRNIFRKPMPKPSIKERVIHSSRFHAQIYEKQISVNIAYDPMGDTIYYSNLEYSEAKNA